MEKIITLSQSIRQSIAQILKNDLLGFFIKSRLYSLAISVLFVIPILIPVFSMIIKERAFDESKESIITKPTSLPNEIDNPETNPFYNPPKVIPGPFEVSMFVVGGLMLVVYGIACLNLHTLVNLKIAQNITEPIKPLMIQSFKRSGVMFIHMVIKGFILLFGFLLFIIPGVIFTVKYFFSETALLNENLGPIAALKRSAELTKGYRLDLYVKMLGLFGLQLLLLIPFIIFLVLFGNKSVGPVFLEMYGAVASLIFVYFYLDLARIKGNKQPQSPANPQSVPTISAEASVL